MQFRTMITIKLLGLMGSTSFSLKKHEIQLEVTCLIWLMTFI
jgi:hypothetical protein